MLSLKIFYFANVIVAGWIGITSLFFPKNAEVTIFSDAYGSNDVIHLVGCLWSAITLLTVLGL